MTECIVAIADTVFPSLDPVREALSSLQAEVRLAAEPTPAAILDVARQADGLLVTYAKITAEIINQLEKCKIIARFGIGVDNVDIEAATAKGIVVTYVPDYCVDEVSDHTMALLLDLARKVTYADRLVQSGRWEMKAVTPLRRLRGRTLGLLGFGKIPQAVVPKAQSFGLKVVAFDPFVSVEGMAAVGVEKVEFEQLLAMSDYVSVHAPLTPKTENMLNAAAFRQMKSDALIVNTARGPLVDTAALAEALDAGEVGGAALDVVPVEPLPADSPLLGRDNVILNPHTAFYSEESLLDLQVKAAQDVASVLSGQKPKYPLNPQVLGTA